MTTKTLWQGWWSPLSLVINPVVVAANLANHAKIRRLGQPAPSQPGTPLDPGKPVFSRHVALVAVLPLAWWAGVMVYISCHT
ncbi:hypothetical protein SAZ11_07550 [Streptomyces sp. FXJ1.4098]|nr:hypothetical protein [Streptomyces sp. FXJ1.4098]